MSESGWLQLRILDLQLFFNHLRCSVKHYLEGDTGVFLPLMSWEAEGADVSFPGGKDGGLMIVFKLRATPHCKKSLTRCPSMWKVL